MNLTITRDITNELFTTTIQVTSLGSTDITPIEEENLLGDYPINLDFQNITFTGKFNVSTVGNNVIVDETAGETITLSTPRRILAVNKDLIITYSISKVQILPSEVQTKLSTAELVCQAKILLFENCIKTQLQTLMTNLKAKKNDFLLSNPINVTI